MNYPSAHNSDGPLICRINSAAIHLPRYSFRGLSVLARDAGVSHSSLSRLIHGKGNPSYRIVLNIAEALTRELGHHIDPTDLVAKNGHFPTMYICDVMDCRGCLPDEAHDEFGDRTELYKDVTPGEWVMAQHPKGFNGRKGAHGD